MQSNKKQKGVIIINKVILIGRLTKDPELRKTPNDISVVQFTIAVNRSYSNENGEKQADFINCIAWRNQAENLAKYIKKGGQIAIEGSIQTRSYEDQNGMKRYVTEVLCNQITFLEPKRSNSDYDDLSQLEPPATSQQKGNPFGFGDIEEEFDVEDLPF